MEIGTSFNSCVLEISNTQKVSPEVNQLFELNYFGAFGIGNVEDSKDAAFIGQRDAPINFIGQKC